MTNVIDFPGVTRLPLDPEKVLEAAQDELETVLVIGYTKGRGEFWFASSEPSGPECLWLLETAKRVLMQVASELEEGGVSNHSLPF